MSICENYYGLVIVDDDSRYTWTLFIITIDDAFTSFKRLVRVLHNEKNCNIFAIKMTVEESFKMKDLKFL